MEKSNLEENRIHPYLSYYAYHFLDVYTKSVAYSIKDMSNYTYWFQPNVVGINYAFEKDEVTDDIEKELGINIKLYSFKIRRSVGFHNLRESYFNALSTSMWAHRSYLVLSEIEDEEDEDIQNEIKKLSEKFNQGIIKLDIDDPESSHIIIPANNNKNLDMYMFNRLKEENKVFSTLLSKVMENLPQKKIIKDEFNKISKLEDLKVF